MKRFLLVAIISWQAIISVMACRFTVREIGFSTLAQDVYTLVVLDKEVEDAAYWRKLCKDANIRLEVLHPEKDKGHPLAQQVLEQTTDLPAWALIAPNGRLLMLQVDKEPEVMLRQVQDSPVRRLMRQTFPSTFSVVLCLEGDDTFQNKQLRKKAEEACEQVRNMMPHMPKEVRKGPEVLYLNKNDWKEERVLLWSLGLEQWPTEAKAVVIYGRGRIMGDVLSFDEIEDDALVKYMSMIGADCECGLDRKWMLGYQVPLLWSKSEQQELANQVGFDVDNPMILAEMSRILAKETEANAAGGLGFGPETVDLSQLMAEEATEEPLIEESEVNVLSMVLYALGGLSILIVVLAVILMIRLKSN